MGAGEFGRARPAKDGGALVDVPGGLAPVPDPMAEVAAGKSPTADCRTCALARWIKEGAGRCRAPCSLQSETPAWTRNVRQGSLILWAAPYKHCHAWWPSTKPIPPRIQQAMID